MAQVAVRENAVRAEVAQILIPKKRVGEMLTIQGIDLSIQGFSVKSSSTILGGYEVGVLEVADVSVICSENFVALCRNGVPVEMEPFLRVELIGVRSKEGFWLNPRFCGTCGDLLGRMLSRSPILGEQYICQGNPHHRWVA